MLGGAEGCAKMRLMLLRDWHMVLRSNSGCKPPTSSSGVLVGSIRFNRAKRSISRECVLLTHIGRQPLQLCSVLWSSLSIPPRSKTPNHNIARHHALHTTQLFFFSYYETNPTTRESHLLMPFAPSKGGPYLDLALGSRGLEMLDTLHQLPSQSPDRAR